MTETNRRVQSIIARFVTELTQVAREEAASIVLGGLGTPRATRSAAGGGRGAKRSPERLDAMKQKLVVFVTKHPGLRTEEINKQIGTTTKDLALPMRQLVAERKLQTTGLRRATRYYVSGAKKAPSLQAKTRRKGKRSRT